jgi:lipopolysaccharide/colanic/teichoic acid biosynthesis glycosyltransferase
MPRALELPIAFLTLAVLAPLLAVLAVAVRLTSRGPALHRAERMGAQGEFTLLKFRTMDLGASGVGPGVTAAGDSRITRIGRLLRRTKLDELPQLWNVVRGEMALVGPRPEDPRYVDLDDPLHREVFSTRPGITGATALAYRDEETILAEAAHGIAQAEGRDQTTPEDVDRAYRESVLPVKVAMDSAYLRTRSTRGDLAIIGRTIGQVLRRTTHH